MDGSVTGADLGDGSLTGADLGDGSVTGADLGDGTVARGDLVTGAVADTRLVLVTDDEGAGAATVFSDPAIGTITFTCLGSQNYSIFASLPATATPGSVKVVGHDLLDNNPGGSAATATQLTPGANGGGVSFPAMNTTVGEGSVFYDTATKRLSLRWDVGTGTTCTMRGEVLITDKTGG